MKNKKYKNECDIKEPSKMSSKQKQYEKYRYCITKCKKCDEKALLKKILFELRQIRRKL